MNANPATTSVLSQAFGALATALLKRGKKTDGNAGGGTTTGCDDDAEKNKHIMIDGSHLLATFMAAAGEPITWVETRELWNGMRQTNNGKLPTLEETWNRLVIRDGEGSSEDETMMDKSSDKTAITKGSLICDSGMENVVKQDQLCDVEELEDDIMLLEDQSPKVEDLKDIEGETKKLPTQEMIRVAKGIKKAYNIRASDDKSELIFIIGALALNWLVVISLVIAGNFHPEDEIIGTVTWPIFAEAIILFVVELAWECFLSWLVLKYDIKINYTRKLGNLLKIPKYFAADLLPFYESTALSMVTSLAVNQTLFCIMFYRRFREKVPFFSYVFLSQDRREDRPDTLIFQVTEDIMRFGVYFPFKLLVANPLGIPAIIFIPIAVNNIGDGLAEPVGVRFGKHKYTTTALYYKGKFWSGQFTRSLEGSACVYFTTLVVVAVNYTNFNNWQFWTTLSVLPFLMTIAEAKAPHTNDGPFLALIGCGFLSLIFLL